MNEFHQIVLRSISAKPDNEQLAKLFLNGSENHTRYLVGKNEQAEYLIKLLKIDGVIDDFNTSPKLWNNVPVVASTKLPDNAIVVNCSSSISPVSVNKALLNSGVKHILNVYEIIQAADNRMPFPWFVEQMRTDYSENNLEWFKLYNQMADEKSRQTLIHLMQFRLTANPSYMHGYSVRLNDQYFEDFMKVDKDVFVDVGGYNGDTTEEFVRRYPNYKKIYFFEPSRVNMDAARDRLSDVKNIEFKPFGLSDKSGQLFFNGTSGSASAISDEGDDKIQVTTLDESIADPVDFIKMDIEGWELKALEGGKSMILKNKPKLAIAVYHAASDFRTIPKFILGLNPHYDLYLRHYTEGWSETVMYFKPKTNFG